MTNIVNLSNQKQIIRIDSTFKALKGIAIKETAEGKYSSYPIVGESWEVRNDLSNFGDNVIGHAGEKIHITNPIISSALQDAADKDDFLIGYALKDLKHLGIKLGVEDVEKKVMMVVDGEALSDEADCYCMMLDFHDYYWDYGYKIPHGDQLPIPDFTFSFTRKGKTEDGKHIYTIKELEHKLGNCLCALVEVLRIRGIRIQAFIGDEDTPEATRVLIMPKEHQQQFFKMLENVNNRVAQFEIDLLNL